MQCGKGLAALFVASALAVSAVACGGQIGPELHRAQPEVAVNSGPSIAPDGSPRAPSGGALARGGAGGAPAPGRCPAGMADIDGRFCIDRYEASLVELLPNGQERPFSPYAAVAKQPVRAVSEANVVPQGYISAVDAQRACAASGKRLCKPAEWGKACRGPEQRRWGYGEEREPGRCNDNGKNPIRKLYGGRYSGQTMNQPALNQLDGTLARTGEHAGCTNGYGVYDMVGNLHEWVADPSGTFYGGYYQDVQSPGHGGGCGYVTTAHEARYHDYSTGFRCCADLDGEPEATEDTHAPRVEAPMKPSPRAPRKRRR